jgi:hypothetical protein
VVHKHRGNSFQCQNYKMRLKQRSLNWINSMQVKKILFTNVFSPLYKYKRDATTMKTSCVGYFTFYNKSGLHFYLWKGFCSNVIDKLFNSIL